MKKFILSVFVVTSLITYSVWQNKNKSADAINDPVVNSPTTGVTSTQPSSYSVPTLSSSNTTYKDGTFTGDAADAFYGYVQVQVTISGGKVTNVQVLQYPNDRSRSAEISQYSLPTLRQEVIQVQSANVDAVSGASDTSQAFIQSVSSALQKAAV